MSFKSVFTHLGAICAAVLVFALGMIIGADVAVWGWLLWYLFALSLGAVGGMVAMLHE